MMNIMFGPYEDEVGQPPACPPPGDTGKRRRVLGGPGRQLLVAAITSRRMAVAVTILGAVAAMVLHVLYAVVIQGWGSPLP